MSKNLVRRLVGLVRAGCSTMIGFTKRTEFRVIPISQIRKIKQRKRDIEERKESFENYIKKMKMKFESGRSSPLGGTLNVHYDLEV